MPRKSTQKLPRVEDLFEPRRVSDPRPATDATIAWAETKLGVHLPAAYKRLVKARNGGVLRLNSIRLRKPIERSREYTISEIAGVHRRHYRSVTGFWETAVGWGVDSKMIPIEGDGHNWICFDYRKHKGHKPPIVHIKTDGYVSTPIADSLEDLLLMLRPDKDAADETDRSEPDSLNRAVHFGDMRFIRRALASGIDPATTRPCNGACSALDLATSAGNIKIFNLLLQHASKLPQKNAIRMAVADGNTPIVRVLLEHGWKPDKTHLDTAVIFRRPEMVALILGQGITPKKMTVRDAAGLRPPSQIVEGNDGRKHPRILKMLLDAGSEMPREL